MISSTLDLIVSDLPESTVQMTSGCAYGEENALTEIGDGTEVTLVNGNYAEKAVLRLRSGEKCFFGSFELGAPLAKRLRLSSDKRYRLVYDAKSKSLGIGPSPVSAASAPLGSDTKLGAGRLSIGYALLSRLGLPDDHRNLALTLKHGGRSRRLAVRSPANLFEGGLNLHPDAIRALNLRSGTAYRLSYDQRAKELVVRPVGRASADAGPGKADARRSRDVNRSGGAARSGGANRSDGATRPSGTNRSDDANRSAGANRGTDINRPAGANRPAGGLASRRPASARQIPRGAAGKRAVPQPRAVTRNPPAAAAPPADRRASAPVSKPQRTTSVARPSAVFPAALRGGAKRSATGSAALSKPYMPKGRA